MPIHEGKWGGVGAVAGAEEDTLYYHPRPRGLTLCPGCVHKATFTPQTLYTPSSLYAPVMQIWGILILGLFPR